MKLVHSISFALAITAVSAPNWAAQEDQHQAHHPEGTASAPAPKAMPGKTRMDSQMKAMHEMHDKMMAAQTPAERDALTAEHMKIMKDGMTMMNGMSPGAMDGTSAMKGDMAARHQAMEARVEMMQATMQMMMDRLPSTSAK